MNDDVVIRAEGVKKLYRTGNEDLWALKGVDLDIRRGEFLSLMGPSGSGKSTFFNQIGGLDRPTEGRVIFDDRHVGLPSVPVAIRNAWCSQPFDGGEFLGVPARPGLSLGDERVQLGELN